MKTNQFTLIALTLSAVLLLCGHVHQNISFADSDQTNFVASKQNISKLSNRVDFENDLMPVFTKFGCNAGACHGAAAGRGDFKLSLFGGNPRADYEAIVRQLAGRRINLMHPEESLVVLKPTAQISHGGRQVLNENGEGAQLLRNWVQQGAQYETLRQLERVEISPQKQVITNLESPIQLQAKAHFSNSTTEDVTRWTVFTPEDTSAVEIDAATAVAKVNRRGRHIILARYLTEVVPIEFIAPLNEAPVQQYIHENSETHTPSKSAINNIDEEILKLLATLRLPISIPADDTTFLRRVTLDLTGRLPVPDTVATFLTDPDPKKRETLVDTLLQSDEFNEYWTLQLAKLLRIGAQERNTQGAFVYHQWLSEQIREGVGYDQVARSVILATGDSHEIGPANFYRTVNGPREQAEFMSELFMGARLRCANCHNHPLDKWTQDDYHGLAAIFAKIEGDQIVKVKPSGEVIHPATREKAVPRIPGDRFLPADVADGRVELADWLTGSDNPYFAKAIVNRLWRAMMGRGLVEPVDDFRSTNPATHPELLTTLADDFVAHGYDLRRTLRRIALSAAYAHSANTLPQNATDDRFYSHALQKPLEPEVLADAISDVLGVPDIYGDEPEGTRAVSLSDPNTESDALDILGRCGRETSCETSTAAIGGLQRKLHLFNGDLLNARIGVPDSRLDRLMSIGRSPMEIVNEFYLAALSRPPTDTEQQFWKQHIDVRASANSQRAILEDMVWSLLTCNEFVKNHQEEIMHNQETVEGLIVDMVRAAGSHSEINVNPLLGRQERSESIGADEAIKKWIDENGESIVGTRGGPFDPTDRYVTTYKDGKIYVHVLSWEGENHIILPAIIDRVVKNAWILGNPEADGTSWGIVRQHPWGLIVVVPREYQNGVDDIVVLDIEGDPATLKKPQLVEADSSSVVYLLGESAKVDDGLVHLQAQDWIEGWNEQSGSILWNVKLLSPCDYEIAVTYTADTDAIGSEFEIVAGQNRIAGTVHPTSGWAGDSQNFERRLLQRTLHIPAGESTITLRLIGEAQSKANVKIHSLELISPTANAAMITSRERAQKMRAKTDWFVAAKYGVMFHWSTTTQPLRGPQKPYPEAVEAFDLDAFADMVSETGAGYVIFTTVHGIMHFPAPLKSIEAVMPERTCRRDLIGEMADKLQERGIPLIIYFHHGVGDPKWEEAAGFLNPDKSRFFKIECDILTEIGHRYGKKIAGYWFDDRYPLQPFEDLYKATKVGNPARIVSWNSWILPKTTEFQEYYGGEFGGAFVTPPASFFAEGGAASGLQPHGMIFLDDPWQHGYPDTDIDPPLFTNQQIIDYMQTCIAQKLVITMNIGITQDGKVSPATLEQMKALRRIIRGE